MRRGLNLGGSREDHGFRGGRASSRRTLGPGTSPLAPHAALTSLAPGASPACVRIPALAPPTSSDPGTTGLKPLRRPEAGTEGTPPTGAPGPWQLMNRVPSPGSPTAGVLRDAGYPCLRKQDGFWNLTVRKEATANNPQGSRWACALKEFTSPSPPPGKVRD